METRGTDTVITARTIGALAVEARLCIFTLVDIRAVASRLVQSVASIADTLEVALLVLTPPVGTDFFKELALVDVPAFVFASRANGRQYIINFRLAIRTMGACSPSCTRSEMNLGS